MDSKLIHVESFGKTFYQNKARADDMAKLIHDQGKCYPRLNLNLHSSHLMTFDNALMHALIYDTHTNQVKYSLKNNVQIKM